MTLRRSWAVGVWFGVLALAAVVASLAVVELRERGTSSIGGFTVANYKARAEVENTPAPDFEVPGLRRVSERHHDRGVRFLGVDYRDDDAAGRAFVDEFHLPYPSVTDPLGSLAYDYELIGFPTTFLIDPAGTIRYRFVGYLDEDVLEKALSDVLSRTPS